MTFRQALHRHLQALERSDLHARLFATPVEIHEACDAGFAVLHLLYCEDAPGKPALRQQSHLTLVFQKRGAALSLAAPCPPLARPAHHPARGRRRSRARASAPGFEA